MCVFLSSFLSFAVMLKKIVLHVHTRTHIHTVLALAVARIRSVETSAVFANLRGGVTRANPIHATENVTRSRKVPEGIRIVPVSLEIVASDEVLDSLLDELDLRLEHLRKLLNNLQNELLVL